MRLIVTFAALALVAAVFVPRYAATTAGTPPAAAQHMAAAAAPELSNSRSIIVRRNGNGHFEVEGRVDGRRMEFMVDTGASVIALTSSDAAMLGIHPAEREFTALVKTANGVVRGAPVELGMVEIGDLAVHDVAALVLPNTALTDNLLGLSFLSRLHRFEYSEGTLVLEQ
jgi:aspartyl protease family protein